jgi:27-O-demethylrifamycin SV methyltransferase
VLANEHGARVLGISTSEEGLARARARAEDLRVADRVRFELRDGMDNGLDDRSFDVAWVMESSHLMPRREALVSECARVLRPGGRLALCDIVLRRELEAIEVLREARAFDLLRRTFGRARMRTPEFYADCARRSGLEVTLVQDLTAATRPTFSRWRENAKRHRAEVEERIGSEELERFVASCDVLERFWDRGVLGYALIAAEKRPSY